MFKILLILFSLHANAQDFLQPSLPPYTPMTPQQTGPYDPTDDLVAAFQGSCSSVGQLTLGAMNQTSALKKVVEGMKNDPNCDSVSSALTGFIDSHRYMIDLLSPNSQHWKRNQTEARVNQLVSALAVEADPNVRMVLANQLAIEKVNLVNLGFERDRQRKDLLYRGASDFVFYSDIALAALSKDSACMRHRPGVGIQVAGQILALSASFMSGPLGPIFFATGKSVENLVRYFQDAKYNKLLKKASMVRLGPMLGCVFESVAASYCQARDTAIIVRANANPKQYDPDQATAWRGLQLITQDIVKYNDWVLRLVAGSPPTNKAAADLKASGSLLEAGLRIAIDRISATLVTARNKEALTQDPALIGNIRRQLLKDLKGNVSSYVLDANAGSISIGTSSMGGISSSSPFYLIFSYDPVCGPENYFATGKHAPNKIPPVPGMPKCDADDIPNQNLPDIGTIQARADTLIADTGVAVANEITLVRENDGLGVLARAELQGNELVDAVSFMRKTVEYLDQLNLESRQAMPPHLMNLVRETRDILANQALKTIESDLDIKEKLTTLQLALAPMLDVYFLSKRLNSIVQWDLTKRLKSGQLNKELEFVFQESLRETIEIPRNLGVFDENKLLKDAQTSQPVSIDNLSLTYDIFHKHLEKYIEGLNQKIIKVRDSSLEQALNTVCMQLLLLPDPELNRAKKDVKLMRYCSGRTQKTVYQEAKIELRFNEVVTKPFSSRVCAIYDFERKSKIYGLTRK